MGGYGDPGVGSPGLCAACKSDAGGMGVEFVAEAGAAGFGVSL